jgi:hypothetical protein
MGTGGTDALAKSGFLKDEIAAALDYCDNDRAKTLQYLKKQQCGKGGVKWQDALKTALPTMTAPAKVKEYLEWMLEFDNVPLKPKPFKNFVKNSNSVTTLKLGLGKLRIQMGSLPERFRELGNLNTSSF